MKGDFSRLLDERNQNFTGVLHQQGRVLLDADWNAQTAITTDWEDTAGRDVIGAGVAAVPADQGDAFKVVSATHTAGDDFVQLGVNPGRVWADGLLAKLFGEPDPESTSVVTRHATYLAPPVQDPAVDTDSIAADVRDAVILEVWREEVNAFQMPDLLIEPALGGPDTTERANTSFAFRLVRLEDGDTCENISGRIQDDFSAKGKLKVSLQLSTAGSGDCPTPSAGGYSGFEHSLYRIEIADIDAGPPQFKWSQFGGGLVGRGHFDAASSKVTVKANLQAITNSGLTAFYLEALERDPLLGYWRVTYGARATLSGDVITLDTTSFGVIPSNPDVKDTTFFRLWNGIELVQDFADSELPDRLGIMLAFDTPTATNYAPGDYWTFNVRVGQVLDPPTIIDTKPPQGIRYHRVPLAVLTWSSNQDVEDPIEDCRHRFQPLTRLESCCTYRVGDGMHTWGDFDTIQEAVDALPPEGGRICVLAGIYDESVIIAGRVGIRIHGCGRETRVRSVVGDDDTPQPAFLISTSSAIVLENMAIEAGPKVVTNPIKPDPSSAVYIRNAREVTVRSCLIQMRDYPSIWPAIFSRGDDILIDSNVVEVLPQDGIPAQPSIPPELGSADAPASVNTPPAPVVGGSATRGGIQLAGGSDRVRLLHNVIRGGIWNGVTLGSLEPDGAEDSDDTPDRPASADPCDPCKPADTTQPTDPDDDVHFVSSGDLYDIEIAGNTITDMGTNGIGVVRFFDLVQGGDLIGVHGLHITDNVIMRCMRRDIAVVRAAIQPLVAYGGIALAKVSDLRILRNTISNNGSSHIMPICGVYAIFAQGLVLDDNRILENGPRSVAPVADAQPGVRGGVHIWLVLPTVEQPGSSKLNQLAAVRVSQRRSLNGIAVCSMRDNLVIAPLGRAVTFFALGTVIVARNRLVTQGTTGRGLDLIAATVLIGNAGLSNEWTLGLILILILATRLGGNSDNVAGRLCAIANTLGLMQQTKPPTPYPPLVAQWCTGKTLFVQNQTTLDLTEDPASLSLSSILLASLDDVGMTDNQCEILTTNAYSFTDAVVFAGTVRIADNRFAETWRRALYSAMSLGIAMNTTTDNQSTHCMRAKVMLPNMLVFRDNLALVTAFCPDECRRNAGGVG